MSYFKVACFMLCHNIISPCSNNNFIEIERIINEDNNDVPDKNKLVLVGLTWVRNVLSLYINFVTRTILMLFFISQPNGFFKRIHFIFEWPFSLLRWLTIPPCCHVSHYFQPIIYIIAINNYMIIMSTLYFMLNQVVSLYNYRE